MLPVRKLELLDAECISSSAEKNASDGFSEVKEIVLCTSLTTSSSDINLGLSD